VFLCGFVRLVIVGECLLVLFLPSRSVRGWRPVVDDGSLINGVLYVVVTGCRWRDMPSRYGSYVTACRMLNGI